MLGIRPLKRAKRWLFGKKPDSRNSKHRAYADWLESRIQCRRSKKPSVEQPELFSILTCIYHGSPVDCFREAAHSVLTQSYADFQWVLLAQGKLNPELEQILSGLETDARVKLLRLPENLGIFRGMRECLVAATGCYALPLDGDDLLTVDALEIMANAISQHGQPAFLYSDEDMFVDGRPQTPYLRPGWDPVLNISCSYIWHLCAFNASLARQLGVYADLESEWCQDWHSVFRFVDAGYQPVHVPEVLYHWRAHPQSSTNQAGPHHGSLESQRHLLAAQIARQSNPELYTIEPFPIFRGAQEWWIRRKQLRSQSLALVYYANESEGFAEMAQAVFETFQSSQFPFRSVHLVSHQQVSDEQCCRLVENLQQLHREFDFAELAPKILSHSALAEDVFQRVSETLVAVVESGICPEGQEWPWEAQGLFELHADVAMVAGRIISSQGIVCGGGEIFGYAGQSNCPETGRLPHEPGPFALLLKPRSVDAVNSAFFLARTEFLCQAQPAICSAANRRSLGIWLGAEASMRQMRIAATPLVAARWGSSLKLPSALTDTEELQFRRRYSDRLNHSDFYPRDASRMLSEAYEFAGSSSSPLSESGSN